MGETLDCNNCGEVVVTADADGLFYDSTDAHCPECGIEYRISIDDDEAYLSGNDEAKDIGQPKCDGSCGAVESWLSEVGPTPCLWTCQRAARGGKEGVVK